jgi:hypothetical protein
MIKELLYYLTNNLKESKHEEIFDMYFFVLNTLALISGVIILLMYDEPQWIPFLVIEYNWALDNIRHNRP